MEFHSIRKTGIRNLNYILFWPVRYSQLLQYVNIHHYEHEIANWKWCTQVCFAKYQNAVCILAAPVCIFWATGFWGPAGSRKALGVCTMIEEPLFPPRPEAQPASQAQREGGRSFLTSERGSSRSSQVEAP